MINGQVFSELVQCIPVIPVSHFMPSSCSQSEPSEAEVTPEVKTAMTSPLATSNESFTQPTLKMLPKDTLILVQNTVGDGGAPQVVTMATQPNGNAVTCVPTFKLCSCDSNAEIQLQASVQQPVTTNDVNSDFTGEKPIKILQPLGSHLVISQQQPPHGFIKMIEAVTPADANCVAGKRQRTRCTCPTCQDIRKNGAPVGIKKTHICHWSGCGKTYNNVSNLKRHVQKHTGEMPYVCECPIAFEKICGKRFLTSSELKRHYRIHTGERRYQCTECDKRFTRSDHLKKHFNHKHTAKMQKSGIGPLNVKLEPLLMYPSPGSDNVDKNIPLYSPLEQTYSPTDDVIQDNIPTYLSPDDVMPDDDNKHLANCHVHQDFDFLQSSSSESEMLAS